MFALLSITVLVVGITLVAAARGLPGYAPLLERCGGGLMVAGLLLIGSCLSIVCMG